MRSLANPCFDVRRILGYANENGTKSDGMRVYMTILAFGTRIDSLRGEGEQGNDHRNFKLSGAASE